MKTSKPSLLCAYLKPSLDFLLTLTLWTYFTIGFVTLFSPFYLLAWLLAHDRQIAFQRLNHYFCRGFFLLVRALGAGHKWRIDGKIRSLRSAVVVCNHRSYLDPLLLISLFARHSTIVKSSFFSVPVFSFMLRFAGYLPSTSEGRLSRLMIDRIEAMPSYLAAGGNLFVFPEGTRSRNGRIGDFSRGAFKIARQCGAPIEVLFIRNTDRLMRPGRFLFNTCVDNTVRAEHLARIAPDYRSDAFSTTQLMARVRTLLERRQAATEEP